MPRQITVPRLAEEDQPIGPEHKITPEVVQRARRYVASRSTDTEDCRHLLAALGLLGDTSSLFGVTSVADCSPRSRAH